VQYPVVVRHGPRPACRGPSPLGSGEALEERITETALVEKHAQMAEGLLPWVIVLAVGALGLAYVRVRQGRDPAKASWSDVKA
jgi:hypothetical protein